MATLLLVNWNDRRVATPWGWPHLAASGDQFG